MVAVYSMEAHLTIALLELLCLISLVGSILDYSLVNTLHTLPKTKKETYAVATVEINKSAF